MSNFSINSISKITKGDPDGSYLFVECNITTPDPSSGVEDTFDAVHVYRESDQHSPLTPIIKEWLEANPDFTIEEYTPPIPPTPEEAREQMPTLTARQLRLGLLNNHILPSTVTGLIEGMEAGPEREAALVEWEYASEYKRLHPLILTLGGLLNLTPEQIDAMWVSSLNL